MVKQNNLTAAFADIVNKTKAKVLATIQELQTVAKGSTDITTINFQFGHLRELIQTLEGMGMSDTYRPDKYPLVWLVFDTPIQSGRIGQRDEISFELIIAQQTQAGWKAAEREIKSFIPVLRPIYVELMNQIANSPYFDISVADTIEHEYIERYYWGEEVIITGTNSNANKLSDHIDAIQLRGFNLQLNYNCQIPPININ